MPTRPDILTSLAAMLLRNTWVDSYSVLAMTDQNVCYQAVLGEEVPQIHRVNVKRHSRLTTRTEEKELGHPRQTTSSAIGKVTNQSDVNFVELFSADGSVIVARGTGARLRMTVGIAGFFEYASSDPVPTSELWESCLGVEIPVGEVPTSLGPFELRRIDNPVEQPLCSSWNTFNESD